MQRLLVPLALLISLVLGFQALGQEPPQPDEPIAPVSVILLRHAETEATPERHLSEEGHERARAVAHLLAHSGVTHLYSSGLPRTNETLAPLAEATGLEVVAVNPREAARQVALLHDLPPGSVAVVAGHSNTVPAMVAELGGAVTDLEDSRYGPVLAEHAHDRIFVLTLPRVERAGVSTVELRVGD